MISIELQNYLVVENGSFPDNIKMCFSKPEKLAVAHEG
jgi:hypothetical protein